jgi:putative Mg2+ transporter-C (MgtC) family protein
MAEMGLRVGLAFLAGLLIGWERECHGRPAGLRTNILACVAAAVTMLVAQILSLQSAAVGSGGVVHSDPARLGAGLLAGMGFLGAGTILRHQEFVRGVTTAASLWFVTVLGLAFGSGSFVLGGIGLGLALVTLLGLSQLENYAKRDWYSRLRVTTTLDGLDEGSLKERLESLGPRVLSLKLAYDLEGKQKTIGCELKLSDQRRFELASRVVAMLGQAPGVLKVEWE